MRPPVEALAVVLAAASGAYLVARDGSPGWQVVRFLVVVAAACGVLLALRRWTGRRSAAIVFVAGVLVVTGGVGIGLPHLAKAGFTLVTVAGVALLVAGLVLLIAGIVRSMRAVRGWRRVLAGAAMLVVLSVALMSGAQAIAATNVPRTDVGSTTPADLGLPYEDVEFPASDGVVLAGWYIPSTNGAAVALLHGAGSTRSNTLDHAAVLARHGYGVLAYDARGHGDSDGRAMDFGWYGDEDLSGAVTFLQSRPDVDDDRVASVGLSMGGEQAIGAAAADGRIRAVVAEGATNRVAADKAWLSDEYGAQGWLQEQLDRLTYSITDLLTSADPPISLRDAAARAAPRPVLLVAAGDVEEEAHAGRHIQRGSPETVELWVVPGAGHTDGLETEPEEWETRVTQFLAAALDVT